MKTDLTVLITGESGTGKELVAKATHDFSSRSNKQFLTLNMYVIIQNLIESELFDKKEHLLELILEKLVF